MKPLQDLLPQVLQTESLQKYSPSTSEISVYSDTLTNEGLVTGLAKLRKAFPQATPSFFDILSERVKENSFTDNRLRDAVNNLIDNYKYPVPTIADVVGYDKRVKFYTYQDVCDKVSQGMPFEHYKRTKRGQYLSVYDIEMYHLGYLVS